MGEPKVISLKEVKKHNQKDDCWLVIHDKVYDVTKFIEEHPGGEDVILEQVGGYATEPFEDVGHSDAAHEQLDKYCIGVIAHVLLSGFRLVFNSKQPVKTNGPNNDQWEVFVYRLLNNSYVAVLVFCRFAEFLIFRSRIR
ncbi:unnamed protein product [Schistocephalus solidus]|uniref:Cytochrome b5 heme-binding domain-containing protein n=1 Tax=Schistocephalus solidus TaxID=70667 RepID=A0A183SLE1_SCHSO|nr:unnamed protein product [Schistocephalus solidus]